MVDKIAFLNELVNISGDTKIDTDNFDVGMNFDTLINLFYEIICILQLRYNIHNKIFIEPVDFNSFDKSQSEFIFGFNLSDDTKVVINCADPIVLPGAQCFLQENPTSAGYIARIIPIAA